MIFAEAADILSAEDERSTRQQNFQILPLNNVWRRLNGNDQAPASSMQRRSVYVDTERSTEQITGETGLKKNKEDNFELTFIRLSEKNEHVIET